MSVSVLPIGELATQVRGVTYAKEDASEVPFHGAVALLRAGNIQDAKLVLDDLVYVPRRCVADGQVLRRDDVLVATSSGSLDVVGKAARAASELGVTFGAFCKVLRPNERVEPRYFAHYFRTSEYRRTISSLAAGANINNLRNEHLDGLLMPVPAIAEQRRIADILDKADAIRRKRKEASALIEELLRSAFLEMFGDPVTNPKGWPVKALGEVAEVASGVAKGKLYGNEPMVTLPYLRVANVHDGRLDLDEIKTITVSAREGERYQLQPGDVLMTEGGDPDKLGRGAVWRGQVANCIHQNHVFRVRPGASVLSDYLSALAGSSWGKRYFLQAAKQTTGIASINMTQLRSFPVRLPPMEQQRAFSQVVERIAEVVQRSTEQWKNADDLFSSLVARAFSGTLDDAS